MTDYLINYFNKMFCGQIFKDWPSLPISALACNSNWPRYICKKVSNPQKFVC